MQLHTVNTLSETINMAENVEKFEKKSWKVSSQVGASTSNEGGNGGKGPL